MNSLVNQQTSADKEIFQTFYLQKKSPIICETVGTLTLLIGTVIPSMGSRDSEVSVQPDPWLQ